MLSDLTAAGAVVLGKTNSPEFGHKATTDNLLFGPTRNPFDLSMNAGGSSGGSAAAVAAGLAAAAQVRMEVGRSAFPQRFRGVVGMKASFGRVAAVGRPNAFCYHSPFVCFGPLTRAVGDAALMLSVIERSAPEGIAFSLPDDGIDYVGATSCSVEGRKIAFSVDLGIFPVTAQVSSIVAEAVKAFGRAGAIVTSVAPEIDTITGRTCGTVAPTNGDLLPGECPLIPSRWD